MQATAEIIDFHKDEKVIVATESFMDFRLEQAETKLNGLKAQNRLLMQLSEALGDYNRYHASKKLGRHATDNECFLHYVENGGKSRFDSTHR